MQAISIGRASPDVRANLHLLIALASQQLAGYTVSTCEARAALQGLGCQSTMTCGERVNAASVDCAELHEITHELSARIAASGRTVPQPRLTERAIARLAREAALTQVRPQAERNGCVNSGQLALTNISKQDCFLPQENEVDHCLQSSKCNDRPRTAKLVRRA